VAERRLTLSDEDALRVRAVEVLVAHGPAAVPDLLERLTDPSWAVRRSVVAGLAQLGDAAVAPLVHILEQRRDDETCMAAAVDALAASRGRAEEAVLALIGAATPPPLLCDVAHVLGRRKASRALPVLVSLTEHHDDNVAVAAVEALGRIGGEISVEALVALAQSGRFFRVFPTIDVLGKSGDPRAVPALLALVANPLYTTEVARALGETGDARAIPALARLAASARVDEVRAAARAVSELQAHRRERFGASDEVVISFEHAAPASAGAALVAALAGAELDERRAIAEVLGWLGGTDAIAGLFGLLADEPAVTQTATASLKRLRAGIDAQLGTELRASDSARRLALLPLVGGRAVHFEALLACLSNSDAAVRAGACEALARGGDARAVPSLFERLGDPDPRVAQAALGGIQSLGSTDTERLTLAAARSSEWTIRRAAYRIIAYFGYPSGLDALLAGAHDADPRLKEAAISGLAYIEDARAAAALLAACGDTHAKTRAAAVRALGQGEGGAASLTALRRAASDDDAWVRYYACQALGRLRDEPSSPLLVARLADPAGQVRVAAVEALARLEEPDAIRALAGALAAGDADVQRAALVGLGQSRRIEALPTLLSALAGSDPSTRLVAVSALAMFDAAEVTRALARSGRDPDEGVRSAAIELLSARPGALATRLLAELVDEPSVRERIIRALATPAEGRVDGLAAALEQAEGERALIVAGALVRLARPDAEAVLLQALAGAPSPARRAAAEALRPLRSPEVLAALEAASVGDPDASVRRTAALALEG